MTTIEEEWKNLVDTEWSLGSSPSLTTKIILKDTDVRPITTTTDNCVMDVIEAVEYKPLRVSYAYCHKEFDIRCIVYADSYSNLDKITAELTRIANAKNNSSPNNYLTVKRELFYGDRMKSNDYRALIVVNWIKKGVVIDT